MNTFICQQCKQPTQLDSTLTDPSAYDSLSSALPNHPSRLSSNPTSLEEQLSRLDLPDTTKSRLSGHGRNASESFVLLKDSTIRSSQPHPPRPSLANRATTTKGSEIKKAMEAAGKSGSPGKDLSSPPKPSPIHIPRTSISSSPSSKSGFSARSPPNDPAFSPSTPTSAKEPPLAPRRTSAIRLFSLLQSRSDIDHPLCSECTNLMIESLQRQLEETKKERDGYLAFERAVKKEKEKEKEKGSAEEKKALQRMEQLKAQEVEVIRELRKAEEEEKALEAELAQLEMEERALEEDEIDFWTRYSETALAQTKLQDTLTSLEHQQQANTLELSKLSRTNVYNDAFCIGHDGVFGTINGLRLGRVQSTPVEWSEINAAWGMTVLLLATIARKVDFVFETWRLVPMGSFSKIERMGGNKDAYELYGSGDFNPLRWVHNRRFDTAMVAFLDCLRQLMEYARSQDPTVEFPQHVHKDKIGEASIKLPFAGDESWTRALRHVLLALKLLLKWATNG